MLVYNPALLEYVAKPKEKTFNPKKIQKFCHDCGSRLGYYPSLSNSKAENKHRVLTYVCMTCTEDSDKPVLIRVSRNEVQDPLKVVNLEIKHAKRRGPKPRALSPKTRKKIDKKIDAEITEELNSGNTERAQKLKDLQVSGSIKYGM